MSSYQVFEQWAKMGEDNGWHELYSLIPKESLPLPPPPNMHQQILYSLPQHNTHFLPMQQYLQPEIRPPPPQQYLQPEIRPPPPQQYLQPEIRPQPPQQYLQPEIRPPPPQQYLQPEIRPPPQHVQEYQRSGPIHDYQRPRPKFFNQQLQPDHNICIDWLKNRECSSTCQKDHTIHPIFKSKQCKFYVDNNCKFDDPAMCSHLHGDDPYDPTKRKRRRCFDE